MRLALVEWVDSQLHPGWQPAPDARRALEESTLDCQTVGWILHDDDRYIALATSQGQNDEVCDIMQIPKAAVTRVQTLTLPTLSAVS